MFAGFIKKEGVQSFAVLRAELEDVADFDGAPNLQRLAAIGAGSPARTVRRSAHWVTLNIAADGNIPKMETIFVRARGHVRPRRADVHRHKSAVLLSDGPEAARMRAERIEKFLRGSAGRNCCGAEFARQLGFIELIVSANQNENRFALDHIDQRFDLVCG